MIRNEKNIQRWAMINSVDFCKYTDNFLLEKTLLNSENISNTIQFETSVLSTCH